MERCKHLRYFILFSRFLNLLVFQKLIFGPLCLLSVEILLESMKLRLCPFSVCKKIIFLEEVLLIPCLEFMFRTFEGLELEAFVTWMSTNTCQLEGGVLWYAPFHSIFWLTNNQKTCKIWWRLNPIFIFLTFLQLSKLISCYQLLLLRQKREWLVTQWLPVPSLLIMIWIFYLCMFLHCLSVGLY